LNSEQLQIAVRAFTRAAHDDETRLAAPVPLPDEWRYPLALLVLDTETTTDPSQRLLFASYRIIEVTWTEGNPSLSCLEEGLIHPDDLANWRRAEFRVLVRYCREHAPATDPDAKDSQANLRLRSLSDFLDEVWKPLCYQAQAQVVCFNAPFDLSRLACRWSVAGPPRRRKRKDGTYRPKPKRSPFEGGFSLSLKGEIGRDGKWHDNPAWPRLKIKHIDSKRALKAFGPVAEDFTNPEDLIGEGEEASSFRGHLLDLRTLTFALTDRGHTLESACQAFRVPYTKREVEHGTITPDYVEYNREDVNATMNLWAAAMAEYVKHPIDLQATKAYSPASIGKAYLRAMGLVPPLERLGGVPDRSTWDEVLGFAMVAYYGGRAECRIRRSEVPVVLCDFTSMYPTVQALMGLERFLTCGAIDAMEASPEVTTRWIRRVTVDRLLMPETWRKLTAICLVAPQPGDIFPIRARYAGHGTALGIGVSEWADAAGDPLWYTLPDVVASYLLSGRVPRIERVSRFEPRGKASGLRPVKIRGEVEADVRSGRFFASIVEARAAMRKTDQKTGLGLFLKVLANSASYGIFAEMNRHELSGKRTENLAIFGLLSFEKKIRTPEKPGAFFFAPTAALVTGAARLMLAILEMEVSGTGGMYAFCDTDSMAIVAARRAKTLTLEGAGADGRIHRQQVRALSWDEVRDVAARFGRLNPYRGVEHLLKVEDENFTANNPETGRQRELRCFAISAKRYRLRAGRDLVSVSDAGDLDAEGEDEDSEGLVVKRSEHGLGHLLNPTDPEDDSRDWIAEAWRWIPAHDLGEDLSDPGWLDLPAVSRTQVSTPNGMKAFGALNRGRDYAQAVKPFNFLLTCYPDPTYRPDDDQPFRLVSPYERDPNRWIRLTWYEVNTGERYRITTHATGSEGVVRVRSYREILADYRTHEESKSLGPDGLPCKRRTRGLLARRRVTMDGQPFHVGKESNSIEARMRGEVSREDDYLNRYEPRLCRCGCGTAAGGKRKYVNQAHKQNAYRARGR
jgi:hypothetical protein